MTLRLPDPLAAGHDAPPLPEHVQLTPVSDPGTLSTICAPTTGPGPLFRPTIVYVSDDPGLTVVIESVLVMLRSGDLIVSESVAELLEAEERLGLMLKADPFNEKLMRLRMQHCDRMAKLSALVGMCPRDRARVPGPMVDEGPSVFDELLQRMGGRA